MQHIIEFDAGAVVVDVDDVVLDKLIQKGKGHVLADPAVEVRYRVPARCNDPLVSVWVEVTKSTVRVFAVHGDNGPEHLLTGQAWTPKTEYHDLKDIYLTYLLERLEGNVSLNRAWDNRSFGALIYKDVNGDYVAEYGFTSGEEA